MTTVGNSTSKLIDTCKLVETEINKSVITGVSIVEGDWNRTFLDIYLKDGFGKIRATLLHAAEVDYVRAACQVASKHLHPHRRKVIESIKTEVAVAITMFGRGACGEIAQLALLKLAERKLFSKQGMASDPKNVQDGKLVNDEFLTHGFNFVWSEKPTDPTTQWKTCVLMDAYLSSTTTHADATPVREYMRIQKLSFSFTVDDNQRFLDDPKLISSTYEMAKKIFDLAKRLLDNDTEFHKYKESVENTNPELFSKNIKAYNAKNASTKARLIDCDRLTARLKILLGSKEAESKEEQAVNYSEIKERLNKQFEVSGATWKTKATSKLVWIEGTQEQPIQDLAAHFNANGMEVAVEKRAPKTGEIVFSIMFKNPASNLLAAMPPLKVAEA